LKYELTVVGRRTSYAFDRWLSTIVRAVWTRLGGERGQLGQIGDPLVFVRAGEETTVAPVNALKNLAPDESAAIRSRAIEIRLKKRPWWKIWS
jgi:hypothetical protein